MGRRTASARIGVGGGQSVNLGNRSSFRSTSMFRPAFRLVGLSRTFATSRLARAQAQRQTIQTPKTGDPPIVHYVRRKIEERQKLQSEVCHSSSWDIRILRPSQLSEDALSDEDIRRVRRIKELEPLQNAWTEWKHAKQVSVPVSSSHV